MRVRLSQLSKMSPGERDRALTDLVRAAKAPPNGQMKSLEAEIREFEVRYEMTSEEMREAFKASRIRDTADISRWLMLLRIRDRVAR